MRTEIPVINQKELTLFRCIPRQQAWDDVLSIFFGGGRKEETRNLMEKGETLERIGGKGQNSYTKKKSLANSLVWGNIWYIS